MVRLLSLLILASCTGAPAGKESPAVDSAAGDEQEEATRACVEEGDWYFVRYIDTCCEGLAGVSAEDIPRDDYTQDDYPPGCGPEAGTPPDVFLCVACGDGVCGVAEHFCNCATDCEFGEVGPSGG